MDFQGIDSVIGGRRGLPKVVIKGEAKQFHLITVG
jgi:hypothetical protein